MSKIKKVFLSFLAVGLFLSGLAFQANAQQNISADLAGKYQLDTSKSENINNVVENAARNNRISASQKADLKDELEAPKTISIDIRTANQVTLSTSLASAVTFTADGRMQNSGSTNMRATLRGQELRISSSGGKTNYLLTFTSIDGGRSMRVTKMVTTDYLPQTVFADSFYNKTSSYSTNNTYSGNRSNTSSSSDTPRNNDTYSDNDGYSSSDSRDDGYTTTDSTDNRNYPNSDRNYPNSSGGNYPSNNRNYPQTTNRSGNFYVPYGTVLSGILENRISTRSSQENDKFRMRIDSPGEYRGAIIDGYLTGVERSGNITGSSKLTFNFETIRLRNGQTYDFAGVLQNVTDRNGRIVDINDEGQIKGDSQTKQTVKRGGIGAGLGAILGGILGGGKGAIIGATIGGSAGAGSVILDGKDDVELEQGSTISVQSTSPNR
jgi:hypothetical protein